MAKGQYGGMSCTLPLNQSLLGLSRSVFPARLILVCKMFLVKGGGYRIQLRSFSSPIFNYCPNECLLRKVLIQTAPTTNGITISPKSTGRWRSRNVKRPRILRSPLSTWLRCFGRPSVSGTKFERASLRHQKQEKNPYQANDRDADGNMLTTLRVLMTRSNMYKQTWQITTQSMMT